jgi:sterol desaturase/sphingolipid hydroxylase (fatty acid hydroxylase superfamily)
MESFEIIFNLFSIPILNFTQTTGRLSWIYLLSASVIGFFAILVQFIKRKHFSLKEFLFEVFNFSHWKSKSSLIDYLYYFVETILYTVFFSYFVITTLSVSIFVFKILLFIGGEQRFTHNAFIQFLYTLFFLLAYDFGRFYVHKLMHTYSWLWEFHKFHHSAETLNPFTVYRVHPVESILLNSLSGICSGIVTGVFVYFFPAITMYSFLGVNFGLFLFHLYSNLRHTQVWIFFPIALSYILLSPAQHQIHHSKKEEHRHKNLGAIFGFWDFFANSLYIPKEKEELEFGLPTVSNPSDYTSLPRIFLMPFRKVFIIIARNSRRS